MSETRAYGAERRSRRLWAKYAILAAAVAGAVVFATLCPIRLRPHMASAGEERFAAYLVLGFLTGVAFRRRWLQATLTVVVFAVALELGQELIPGRHARTTDAVLKVLGGLLGVSAGNLIFPLRRAVQRRLRLHPRRPADSRPARAGADPRRA